MTPMQLREVTFCPEHRRSIVVLENVGQGWTFAFAADPEEAHRLAQLVRCGRSACHPIYDFIQSLLEAFQATVTHVVLDDVTGKGLRGCIAFQRPGTEYTIPCYATDALALAVRAEVPIYVTARALAYVARPSPAPRVRDAGEGVQEWLERVRPEDFHTHREDEDV